MNRVDLLPERALVRELKLLESDLRDFAGNQPVSQKSGIRTYETTRAQQWDYQATVGSDAEANTLKSLVITVDYTGNGSQEWPMTESFANAYFNGTTESDVATIRTNGEFQWNDADGRAANLTRWGDNAEPIFFSDPYKYRWIYRVEIRKQVTVYFKASVSGTSPGTLSVSGVVL